jgi:glycosyltransferase involved in cell wall biosynthesis
MTARLAIYHPAGQVGLGQNVFGKDVANFQLFQALARHGGLDQVDFLAHAPISADHLRDALVGAAPCPTRISSSVIFDQAVAVEAGALLRGSARLEELAWQRRRAVGDRAYSLMGLIHTIAPPAIRQEIGAAGIAPIHPWDALICTSPSVQSAMRAMFDEWSDYLADRFGGAKRPQPMLPLIPLGVDGDALAAAATDEGRRSARQELGVDEDDIVLLWVGRLSFFEKAFPQSMMLAAEAAAQATGKRMHLVMVGWFPDGADGERRYRQAAAAHAPSVTFHIANGNDRARLGSLWAAGDIFLSLVDNIQETFGITPLEAMACGLPVVVSDWDGYRYTVRDGEEGFLIPTLGGPEDGLVEDLVGQHMFGMKSYQQYVGIVAQHTAVHVGRAAEAIAQLANDPALRRRMGEAGRRRIRDTFDWRVVAPQYTALAACTGRYSTGRNRRRPSPRTSPHQGRSFQGLRRLRDLDPDARDAPASAPRRQSRGSGGHGIDRTGHVRRQLARVLGRSQAHHDPPAGGWRIAGAGHRGDVPRPAPPTYPGSPGLDGQAGTARLALSAGSIAIDQ